MSGKQIRRIHFIEYHAKVNTIGSGLIFPKYGTTLLAAILKERGYRSRVFLESVSEMSIEAMADCDLVCFPAYFAVMNKIRDCVETIRRLKPDLPVVLGGAYMTAAGHQVEAVPAGVVPAAAIVLHDGEESLDAWLGLVLKGEGSRTDVANGCFPGPDGTFTRAREGRWACTDLDSLPVPMWTCDGLDLEKYLVPRYPVPLPLSRGCHWFALFVATLVATSPFQVYAAIEVRMYSLGTALAALSSWLLLRVIRARHRGWGWCLFGSSYSRRR